MVVVRVRLLLVVVLVVMMIAVVLVVVLVGRVAKREGWRAEVRGRVAVVGGVVRRIFVAIRVWVVTHVWREMRLVLVLLPLLMVVALFQIVGMGARTRAGVGDGDVLVAVLGLTRGSSGWRVGAPHHRNRHGRRRRRRGVVEGPRSGELVSSGAAHIARVGRRRRAVVVRVRRCLRRKVLWGLVVGVVLDVRVRGRRMMVVVMVRQRGGRRGIAVCALGERVREHGLSTARRERSGRVVERRRVGVGVFEPFPLERVLTQGQLLRSERASRNDGPSTRCAILGIGRGAGQAINADFGSLQAGVMLYCTSSRTLPVVLDARKSTLHQLPEVSR